MIGIGFIILETHWNKVTQSIGHIPSQKSCAVIEITNRQSGISLFHHSNYLMCLQLHLFLTFISYSRHFKDECCFT